MTDEQIKQNAEAYANSEKQYYIDRDCYGIVCEAHIAGAHSLDEEIAELKEKLKFADESIADADKWIAKYKLDIANLEAKLNQLRNPWISVEERFPERENDKASWSNYVFIRTCFNSHEEAKYDTINHIWYNKHKKILDDSRYVTHWMPIPQTKKGE